MSERVPLQVVALTKSPAALTALEGPFARVSECMPLQMPAFRGPVVAQATLKKLPYAVRLVALLPENLVAVNLPPLDCAGLVTSLRGCCRAQ